VSLGILVWVWAVSSFVIARWVYNVVPVNMRGKAEVGMPSGKNVVINKNGYGYGDGYVKGEVVDI
jgi:hypothetical protein